MGAENDPETWHEGLTRTQHSWVNFNSCLDSVKNTYRDAIMDDCWVWWRQFDRNCLCLARNLLSCWKIPHIMNIFNTNEQIRLIIIYLGRTVQNLQGVHIPLIYCSSLNIYKREKSKNEIKTCRPSRWYIFLFIFVFSWIARPKRQRKQDQIHLYNTSTSD